MGHRTQQSLPLKHRQALQMRQRIATFILVLSVLIIVLVAIMSAVQSSDAPCQDRAQQVMYSHILHTSATGQEIISVISDALLSQNISLDLDELVEQPYVRTIDIVDTADNVLAANGFRLLRRKDAGLYRWQLRTVMEQLCDQYPPIDMLALQNVDYEKISYVIKGVIRPDNKRLFMLESSLTTNDGNRISTFTQMQNLFPGFHQLHVTSPHMTIRQTWSYTIAAVAQVYYMRHPLDILIHVEQWQTTPTSESPHFWRVSYFTRNIASDNNLRFVQARVHNAFEMRNWACDTKDCSDEFDIYLQ